ncbi:DUF4037 domain-containing protein [Vibrio sp. SCSIO 43136]|uniref:DUF4037 domain-containing protein n=1 Tax=Vibrio sp. SCSIO 43136 TaxID=2819101 RepID=UPI00207550BB|nr:DUF4037 domain-containing protein [Vibrio sp. SCSIO 43136]USD66146.1 DUF4037 domain-containing protein [Vibrio sp. SCSIO 43136]
MESDLAALVTHFSQLEQVEAIALGGSHSTQMNDELSDYDVYIYTSEPIPVALREQITAEHCVEMELDNQYWETEDDGRLNSGTEIEILYRSIDWLDEVLDKQVFKYQASTGYSTCFWSNLTNCQILYDRDKKLTRLQAKYRVDYPVELAHAIITKNFPLLRDAFPAYATQIKKALQRNDIISVHHRLTEYLASYFDILFALNQLPHPGEKRLLDVAKRWCPHLPQDFEHNIEQLLYLAGIQSEELPMLLHHTTLALEQLITQVYKGDRDRVFQA